MTTHIAPHNEDPIAARSGWALAMLMVVYILNFVDRQIIGILAVPIKADLGLTDTQLGLLGGFAFALFYTFLAIPIAILADRASRSWIITIALALWSLMTAVCGLAQNFWQLFFARLGVGIGEAGGVTPSYSLISDYFPPGQRARALGIFSFGIPIGSALGIVAGGFLASLIDWRVAFFTVGAVGILFAPIFRAVVKEPERGRYDPANVNIKAVGFGKVLSTLLRKKSFWFLCGGASFASMMSYGLPFWLPSFFVRSYSITLIEASLIYGAVLLVGGIAGIWLGSVLADRFGVAKRSAFALIPALAFVATVPFFIFGVLSPTLWVAAVVLVVPTGLGLAWLGPILSAVQHVVPPTMRATGSAVFLFIANLIGLGFGIPIVGAISDALAAAYGENSLRYAIVVGSAFYVVAAIFFFFAAPRLQDDWEGENAVA